MRVLYKALASVGMLALSTAAALGVRHLAIASKKRKETQNNGAPAPAEESPIHETDSDAAHEAQKEVEDAVDNIKEGIENVTNKVGDAVEDAVDQAKKIAQNVKDRLGDVVESDVEIGDGSADDAEENADPKEDSANDNESGE